LFDIKVNYKFVSFINLADLSHEGFFEIERKLEEGLWKTHVTLKDNSLNTDTTNPRPFFDLSMESDHETKALMVLDMASYPERMEIKLERVPGEKLTVETHIMGGRGRIDLVLSPPEVGLHVSGDTQGSLEARWRMESDFKQGNIEVKYNEEDIAIIQLTGKADMVGYIPMFFSYDIEYVIGNGGSPVQGKANVMYDGKAAAKKLRINFTPIARMNCEFFFELDLSSGIKYLTELKLNGAVVMKTSSEYEWVNDPYKFERTPNDENILQQTSEEPIYEPDEV